MPNHTEIMVPVHGGLLHSTYIFLAKYICMKRGYKLKNPDSFAMLYKSPGMPDIYIEFEYKKKDEMNRLRIIKESVCIEIESNLTNTAYDKKVIQFTRPGMREPIIIDMGRRFEEFKKESLAEGKDYKNDILWAEAYIDDCIVL
jgi:hypothetical protein